MGKIDIQVLGTDKVIRELIKKDKTLTKQIGMEVQAEASDIARTAKNLAPKGMTGDLAQKIIDEKIGNLTFAVTAYAPYAGYVEFGTGAKVYVPKEMQKVATAIRNRKTGSFEQGLQSIKDWCKHKGIPEEAAYPIFVKILNEGIEPRPFLYPAFVRGRFDLIKRLKKLLKRYD